MRLRLEIKIKRHFTCNSLYFHRSFFIFRRDMNGTMSLTLKILNFINSVLKDQKLTKFVEKQVVGLRSRTPY